MATTLRNIKGGVALVVVIAGTLLARVSGYARPCVRQSSVPSARITAEMHPTDLQLPTTINTQSDFDHSEFCRRYRCKERDHRPLQNGEANHIYETSINHLSVNIALNKSRDPNVTAFVLVFHGLTRLSNIEYDAINTLTRSSDQTAKHDNTILFIRANIERAACLSCQDGQAMISTMDGDFRIWAGKSGPEQVIIFERVGSAKPIRTGNDVVLDFGTSVVRIGDLANDVLPILNSYQVGKPVTSKDPDTPGSFVVRSFYKVEGKVYSVEFRRRDYPGPYRVSTIVEGIQ